MLTPLQDPRWIEYYEANGRDHYRGEDWQPMVRAVQYLRSRDYAPLLTACTSLDAFRLTTAQTCEEFEHHHFIRILWSASQRQFSLSWSADDAMPRKLRDRHCEESAFQSAVDTMIQRLLLLAPDSNAK